MDLERTMWDVKAHGRHLDRTTIDSYRITKIREWRAELSTTNPSLPVFNRTSCRLGTKASTTTTAVTTKTTIGVDSMRLQIIGVRCFYERANTQCVERAWRQTERTSYGWSMWFQMHIYECITVEEHMNVLRWGICDKFLLRCLLKMIDMVFDQKHHSIDKNICCYQNN